MEKQYVEKQNELENDQHEETDIEVMSIKRQKSVWKQVAVAFTSALMIGLVFGFVILKMVKQEEKHLPSILHTTTDKEQIEGITNYELDALHIFVVQGGVFVERENSEEWKRKFKNMELPAFIWEESDQFFLFNGIATTLETAKRNVKRINDIGLDSFAKEWKIDSVQVEVTPEEYEWLKNAIKLFKQTLNELETKEEISFEQWEQLIGEKNIQSTKVKAFIQVIEQSIQNGNVENYEKTQETLLYILYQYVQIFKNDEKQQN